MAVLAIEPQLPDVHHERVAGHRPLYVEGPGLGIAAEHRARWPFSSTGGGPHETAGETDSENAKTSHRTSLFLSPVLKTQPLRR